MEAHCELRSVFPHFTNRETVVGPEHSNGLLELTVTPVVRHRSLHCVPVAPVASLVAHFTPLIT